MAKKKAAPSEPEAPSKPSEYTVLARRYRPRQFSELVGQEAVAQALVNALKSNRVAHAYLFTGTRGVGKTSAARILAKALNCVKGPTPTPCDECPSCQAIAVGEDVDVLEIDGASNNKVEEIRELRQNVGFRPSRSRYKIYVIDEVHMLTQAAFNALLKTLEEPPPHVKFIFATTELQKIPITILSRCQRFDFVGIAMDEILARLKDIVAGEGAEAEDEALAIIARRAAGSMRDAQSLLDQVLAFGEERITTTMVRRLLGTADEDLVAGLATAILRHDVPQSLELLDQCVRQGVEFGELVDQLVEYWRDLMLLKATGADAPRLNFAPRFHEAMRAQLDGLSLDGILAALDLLAATKARLRDARHARVLVEMLLVRLGRLEHLMQVATLARELDGRLATRGTTPAAAPARAEAPATFSALKKNSPVVDSPPPAPQPADPAVIPLEEAHLDELWRKLLAEVGTTMVGRRIVSDLQHKDSLAISGPNCLVIRLPSPYTREKQACEDPDRLGRLEAALQRLTGRAAAIRFELVDSPTSAQPAASPAEPRGPRQRRDAWQEPLVRRAMETLGASLIRLDEGFGSTSARTDQEANADDVQGT